ncbi:MAG: tetratricopeptide repeat protein, partial [Nitrospirota bacterium]|nr:tetratricopeptide repeat protein [Nitrospirota bacterium]
FNLGDVYYRIGDYDTAIAYLKIALDMKLSPKTHLAVLNKLGRTYSAMGEINKAIEIFEETIRLFPSATAPYNNLGVQYINVGKFDLAAETFEKGLKIKEEPFLRSNLAVAYAKKAAKEKNAEKQK